MAPKQPCAKYQYVVTPSGPKIVPVPDVYSKDEESPADYNSGGYLQVKINDSFKDGRYIVLRKLGYVFSRCFHPSETSLPRYLALRGRLRWITHITRSDGVIFRRCGSQRTPSKSPFSLCCHSSVAAIRLPP